MRRALLPAALLALLVAVALILFSALARPAPGRGPGGAARVEQVDTSAYPAITLFVSMADASGRPLTGLGRDDFTVTEDGTPVEVADFRGGGDGAVTAALVVDRSLSMDEEDKIDGAREAAQAFVELMRPGDRAALVTFNEEVELEAPFTGDGDELREAIRALRANGGTALYDAVVAGVELLRDEPGRRLLVVLSDGQDCSVRFDSCPDEYGSERTLDEAIAYAQAAGQPVAVVGLGDRGGDDRDGIDEAVLGQIAAETGGRYFYAPRAEDLAGLYADLAGEVQREYRLTYVSPRPSYDGTRRDIEVWAGGSVAAGGYTERHLINVVSSPLTGVVLLTPLVALLALPAALGRRRGRPIGRGAAHWAGSAGGQPVQAPALAQGVAPAGALAGQTMSGSTILSPGGPRLAPPGPSVGPEVAARQCASCGRALRAGARFCPGCGSTQAADPQPADERRTFCDMCGRPLTAGAKFCMGCGEAVARRGEGAQR